MVCGIINLMGQTTQVTQESQPAQPQKPIKPTGIKILQWVYLILGVGATIGNLTIACIDCVPEINIPAVIGILSLFVTSAGLLVFNKTTLKIAILASIIATFSISEIHRSLFSLFTKGMNYFTDDMVFGSFIPFLILAIFTWLLVKTYLSPRKGLTP